MEIHRLEHLPSAGSSADLSIPRGGVATLGVFDGVHVGHQEVLRRVCDEARRLGGPSIVLTFAAHPVVVLRGLAPRSITSLKHRLRLFAQTGIEHSVVLPFDDEVRQLTARDFATRVFVDALSLRGLVLGPDARIGHDRQGDIPYLRRFCRETGIELVVLEDQRQDDRRISSTRVRAAIADGDLVRAREMLGRPVSMLGTVVAGDQRGRSIGFPTANLDLHHEIRPPAGVYAVRAIVGSEHLAGVANIGTRPTFGPDGDLQVEVHILDRDLELYGTELEVELIARIRDEMRFDSKDALIRQINADIAGARAALGQTS